MNTQSEHLESVDLCQVKPNSHQSMQCATPASRLQHRLCDSVKYSIREWSIEIQSRFLIPRAYPEDRNLSSTFCSIDNLFVRLSAPAYVLTIPSRDFNRRSGLTQARLLHLLAEARGRLRLAFSPVRSDTIELLGMNQYSQHNVSV